MSGLSAKMGIYDGVTTTADRWSRMSAQDWEIGVVELFYEDLAAAKAFFQDGLGLTVDREDDTSVSFVVGELVIILLTMDSARELVEPLLVAPAAGSRACFTIHVRDLEGLCSELAERGLTPVNGPVVRPWGPRAAYFADPGGYVFEFVAAAAD
jgi:catechol 2,3-dioxygenase-like lactoylglutathione lyase family enzyme